MKNNKNIYFPEPSEHLSLKLCLNVLLLKNQGLTRVLMSYYNVLLQTLSYCIVWRYSLINITDAVMLTSVFGVVNPKQQFND